MLDVLLVTVRKTAAPQSSQVLRYTEDIFKVLLAKLKKEGFQLESSGVL